MTPTKTPPKIVGWKAIAVALDVCEDTAQAYAVRNVDPLPVFYDHAERPFVRADAAQDWIDRNTLPHRAYHVLKSRGELPGQRSKGKPKRQRR